MTQTTKLSEIQRQWHHIDLQDKILGRIASEIAQLLIGKSKAYFVKNLDCGDYVVVTNAKAVRVTGRKELKKKYYRHSMYPGGFRKDTLQAVRENKPEDIIIHAVKGMLPQNKLRASMLKRLFVFNGPEHKYQDKLTEKVKS